MNETSDVVIGVIFWIGAWQLATLLTERLSKTQQIIIFAIITVISLILIFRLNCKKEENKKENNSSLF